MHCANNNKDAGSHSQSFLETQDIKVHCEEVYDTWREREEVYDTWRELAVSR